MMNSRYKRHKIPIWKAIVFICETTDFDELNKKFDFTINHSVPDFSFANYDAFVWSETLKSGGEHYFVVTRPGIKDSVIAHESVHLANLILDDRGVKTTVSNDEPLAYLVEHLFETVKSFTTTISK